MTALQWAMSITAGVAIAALGVGISMYLDFDVGLPARWRNFWRGKKR